MAFSASWRLNSRFRNSCAGPNPTFALRWPGRRKDRGIYGPRLAIYPTCAKSSNPRRRRPKGGCEPPGHQGRQGDGQRAGSRHRRGRIIGPRRRRRGAPSARPRVSQRALEVELEERCIPFVGQPALHVLYKTRLVGEAKPDILVAECLVVEIKTVDRLAPIHLAQALSYLKITRLPLALVVNFNVPVLLRGVRRVILTGAAPMPSPWRSPCPGG